MILTILFTFLMQAHGQYFLDSQSNCDGYRQITVDSLYGSCVGLVADSKLKDDKGRSLQFPRKIVEWKENKFIIVDMGGWGLGKGKVWLLEVEDKKPRLQLLLDNLILPHGLAIGPDGLIYVGEMGLIFKFNPSDKDPSSTCQIVIQNLKSTITRTQENPCNAGVRTLQAETKISHPLVNFIFSRSHNKEWNLIVNQGSRTDSCRESTQEDGKCLESETLGFAQVLEFEYLGNALWNQEPKVLGQGLRNSMGLTSHPSGVILQFENARDLKDAHEPYEEINELIEGKHYGWPYCYNYYAQSPEWEGKSFFNCDSRNSNYQAPLALLPPHSAPLDAIYYEGSLFRELQGNILVSLHGYREAGQKIIAIPADNQGRPLLNEGEFNYSFYNQESHRLLRKLANPAGGSVYYTPYVELVSKWYKDASLRPRGAPVGITVASDGSIWVVEDKNKSILRIAKP